MNIEIFKPSRVLGKKHNAFVDGPFFKVGEKQVDSHSQLNETPNH